MVLRQAVTRQGKTVVIMVRQNHDGLWRLRVQGSCDQYFTDWLLPFDTALQAVRVAFRAIIEEGIESFYECREDL